MQVNTQNIQRPTLWQSFFTEQMIWNSEYLEYIQTSVNVVTSNLCKTAKTTTNIIKKQLNTKKFINPISTKTAFNEITLASKFRKIYCLQFKHLSPLEYLRFKFQNPQQRNNALSFV